MNDKPKKARNKSDFQSLQFVFTVKHMGNWKSFKYVPTFAQPKYFASLRICIFYTIYANAMIGQRWERSPTA